MSDDGFHEIQLNGKQLVFLFMAATVVSVVIFLCGVMVGRGVSVQQGVLAAAADIGADPTAPAAPSAAAVSRSSGAPISTQETLTYTERLEETDPSAERLLDSTPDPVSEPEADALPPPRPEPVRPEPVRVEPVTPAPVAPAATRPAAPVAAPVAATPVTALASEPAGSGFVVQVAAVNQRSEADAIARRLASKGYPTFVTTPAGAARVFRVRIGKYDDRREAESIALRLEKEEQFKPWITR